MRKTKDILIFIFAIAVLSVIGFTFYFIYDIQKKYNEPSYLENYTKDETRYLYGLANDSLILITEYRLRKTKSDSLIHYNYICEIDLSRSMKFGYNLKTKVLIFDIGTEYEIKKLKVLTDKGGIYFDSYGMMEPEVDGVEPILFNKDYGILALTGALNPAAFFISKKDDVLFVKQIEEILYK